MIKTNIERVDISSFEAKRPTACSRDPAILLNAQASRRLGLGSTNGFAWPRPSLRFRCFNATTMINIAIGLFVTSSWAASHHPQDFLKDIAGSKTEGAQIVQHYCAMCHAEKPMIQLGAPTLGLRSAWEPRIKQGTDLLFKHTDKGLNAMPARGGCFECTDKQLLLAIQAMLPKKQQ